MWLLNIILFAHFSISQVATLCFVSERVTTPKALLSQPSAIDEYHCKILCAEMDACLSYLFDRSFNRCSLLGKQDKQQFMCTNPRNEMVRKTADRDCSDVLAATPIDAEYVRNPDTESGSIVPINTTNALNCGIGIAVIDVTLPDNSHVLYGNTADTKLEWDDKLGSWILKEKDVVYVRAAQCIAPNATELASRESCGNAVIPQCTQTLGLYSYQYPIKFYGELGACVKPKNPIHMQFRRWSTGNLVAYQSVYAYVQCIFGQWFVYGTKWNQTIRVTQANCVVRN